MVMVAPAITYVGNGDRRDSGYEAGLGNNHKYYYGGGHSDCNNFAEVLFDRKGS